MEKIRHSIYEDVTEKVCVRLKLPIELKISI